MQKPAAFLMVTVLLLGLFLMSESRQGTGAEMDTAFGDWIATNVSRPGHAPTRVTLVEINDTSLASEKAWPWSPLEYVLFLRAALPFKPDVVAIELVLNWQDSLPGISPQKMEQYRSDLHDSVSQTPKLVLGSLLGVPDDPEIVPPLQPVPVLAHVTGDNRAVPAFADIAAQAEETYRVTATVGFVNFPDQGAIVRKAPLIFKYRDDEIVPSFILQTLIRWYKLTPDDVKIDLGAGLITLGKAATIPVDIAGRMDVDFNSNFTRFGEIDLLRAVSEQKPGGKSQAEVPTDALKGSIAILARTDTDSRTLLSPSLARKSYGEISAAAIATVLGQAYSRRVSHLFDFAVIAAMMALSCFFHRFPKRTFALISFVALLFYFFAAMSFYSLALVRLPFVLPAGLLLLMNFFSFFSPRETPAAPAPQA